MAFPPPPFTGFVQRFKGKLAAGLGFFGQLFVGIPLDNETSIPAHYYGLFATSGAPTNGTSGTYAKVAPPGSILIDVAGTGAVWFYINESTQASPTWTALTTATGAGTYTGTFNG